MNNEWIGFEMRITLWGLVSMEIGSDWLRSGSGLLDWLDLIF